MNILLPWEIDFIARTYTLYIRRVPKLSYYYGWVGYNNSYNWADRNMIWSSIKNKAVSTQAAMNIVDKKLIKMGWRLLEPGDKLLVLI